MRLFLEIPIRKACRCFVGTSSVEACEPMGTAENRNIKGKLTEMLLSDFSFAKTASVICIFIFYLPLSRS